MSWIIGNANKDQWRSWSNEGPVWVGTKEEATRYARREDAEQVHAEDIDAWSVIEFPDGEVAMRVLIEALKSAKWMLERDFIDDQKMAIIDKCRTGAGRVAWQTESTTHEGQHTVTTSRIYTVSDSETPDKHLVRASNVAQAIAHVSKRFTAAVATQDELVELAKTVDVETYKPASQGELLP